ncbi:hypothetical protein LguiA_025608 [Lonicera macranthoides]
MVSAQVISMATIYFYNELQDRMSCKRRKNSHGKNCSNASNTNSKEDSYSKLAPPFPWKK